MQLERKLAKDALMGYARLASEIKRWERIAEEESSQEGRDRARIQVTYYDFVKRHFDAAIRELSATEQDVVHRHYGRGEMWEHIRRDHGYSVTSIHRVRERALDKLFLAFLRDDVIRDFCRGELDVIL